jgi:hypothetical protein
LTRKPSWNGTIPISTPDAASGRAKFPLLDAHGSNMP